MMNKQYSLILLLALYLPGCLVLVQEDDRHDHASEEEIECMESFGEARFPFVYDYKTDCGDGYQGAIELRKLRYEVWDDGEEVVSSRIQIFHGEETLHQGEFLSSCDGTLAGIQLDFKYGYGQNDSSHAFYRCNVDLNALDQPYTCALLLSDGKVLDERDTCSVTLYRPIKGHPPG